MPAAAALRMHGDPEPPMPCLSRTCTLGDLDDAALDAFLTVTGEGSGSPLLMAELRQPRRRGRAGSGGRGRHGRDPRRVRVLRRRRARPRPSSPRPSRLAPTRSSRRCGPGPPAGQTLNFVEQDGPAADVYEAAAYARLVQTRRRWDPQAASSTSHAIV